MVAAVTRYAITGHSPAPGRTPVDAVQPDQGGLLAVRDQGDVGIQDREPLPARIAGLPPQYQHRYRAVLHRSL